MNIFTKVIIYSALLIPSIVQACWPLDERKEIEGFSELDDILVLSFKDAVDCKVVDKATVTLAGNEYATDYRGYLKLPMGPFSELMDEGIPIKIKREGYITLQTDLRVEAGTVLNRRMVMSRALPPGKIRFVLQWDEEPNDLDLHLKGPGFHISYRHMKSIANKVDLDRDELNGYGPETITLHHLDETVNYSILVDNFSNDARFSGSENLKVYVGNRLLHDIQLKQGRQRAIRVLDINKGSFNILNKSSNRP
jgi:hypothetical protein